MTMKMSAIVVLSLLAVAGCTTSADAEGSDDVASTTTEALTINLNCGKSLPGLPPLPCKPDLKPGQLIAEVWKPGNKENYAPGYYIHFGITNDSDKAAGPFTVVVKNQAGVVTKTVNVAGLGPHQGTQVIEVAPYACGWTRTITFDTGSTVDEFDETNNVQTYDHSCQRLPAPSFPASIRN